MNTYQLTAAADTDLVSIIAISIAQRGLPRTEIYIMELHQAFENLASYPHMGKSIRELRAGYFQFSHDRHNVFYQISSTGITIVRVLHNKQHPKNYL